jgi:endonuclease III
MPVDGHVHRVARRLDWAPEGATANAVQRAVEGAAPVANLMDLHVNLIRLGHRTCREGTPDCRDCPLNDQCATALRQPWW